MWKEVENGKRPKFEIDIPKCYKNLIEKSWSNEPKKRPSFDEIVDLLENSEEFITDEINCDEYYDYIDYIKDNKSCDSFPQIALDYNELDRMDKKNSILNITKIDLNQYEKNHLIKRDDNFKYYEIRNKKKQMKFLKQRFQ